MTARFAASDVRFVDDSELPLAMLGLCDAATERLWISQFIASLAPIDDTIYRYADAVVRAAVAGVDVRVLLDDFRVGANAAPVNDVLRSYLARHGVPCRAYSGRYRTSTHAKYLISDQHTLITSGNWSQGAVERNLELGVMVRSPDHAAMLASEFDEYWTTSSDA